MKALVTGGLGTIGWALSNRLADLGHEVIIFDLPECKRQERYGITVLPRDVRNHSDVFYIPGNATYIDIIFHLAAKADVIPSIEEPIEYHKANVCGTINMLNLAVELGVKKFVYASSTSIYGIPTEYPTPESASADPQYPYAMSKYLGELWVRHWSKVYKLPTVSLRITTAYGPGMRSHGAYGSVFKIFLPQKANNAPFTVTDPYMARDFVYIDDVVEAFIKAAEYGHYHEITDQVFNIGSGKPTCIGDMLKMLGAAIAPVPTGITWVNRDMYPYDIKSTFTGTPGSKFCHGDNVVMIPKRPGEPDVTWADITKAKYDLDWEPKVSFAEGMNIMLSHLNDWKDEPVWTKESIAEQTATWFKYLG